MAEAWFGLVGVIVGGALTGTVQFVLEHRREARLRGAASRLLALELEEARTFIERSRAQSRWQSEPTRVLSNEQWMDHRQTWASSDEAWRPVAAAFLRIADVRRQYAGATAGTPFDRTSPTAQLLETALAAIEVALTAIDPPHRRRRGVDGEQDQ